MAHANALQILADLSSQFHLMLAFQSGSSKKKVSGVNEGDLREFEGRRGCIGSCMTRFSPSRLRHLQLGKVWPDENTAAGTWESVLFEWNLWSSNNAANV